MNGTGVSTYLQGIVFRYIVWVNKRKEKKGREGNENDTQHTPFGPLAKSVPKQKNPDAELWCYKFSHILFKKFVCVGLSQRALAS